MNSARLLLDILLTSAVLAAPFLHSESTAHATGLVEFIAPTKTDVLAAMPRVVRAKKAVGHGPTYTVTATAYQAVPGQTDAEPFVTADNSFIKPYYGSKIHWMALSRDLLAPWGGKFKFGDKVRVHGISSRLDGVYTIHDTMNKRHHHCMDILTHRSEKFDIFCKGVKIQKVTRL